MKIFLGDLVHTWNVSVWTAPLNVGYVAAYAEKYSPSNFEFKIFKDPELMIKAIREESPDVVALSFYVWNENLNKLVMKVAKECSLNILTIGGGPIFTNINSNKSAAEEFFLRNKFCDLYVLNQGEKAFLDVVNRYDKYKCNSSLIKRKRIDGVIVNDLDGSNEIRIGKPVPPLVNLDEIPSPYLNGMLDDFFDGPFDPIIETNRSCPYRCTFCAWGIGTPKLSKFSIERVKDEIKYIAKKNPKSSNLFIADANFAVLERDVEIADFIKKTNKKFGYPARVSVQWNKTRVNRVGRVAKKLHGIAQVGASMQSLSDEVLNVINRKNLSLEEVVELNNESSNDTMFSELILGLPLETVETHLKANKKLINLDMEVFNYNLHLLPGTEMDTVEQRKKYFKKTGWRLHDNAFGIYDGVKIFEGQEVVLETSTMSINELRSFRFFHFLMQFMWGRRWFYDYLKLFDSFSLHPVDVVLFIIKEFQKSSGEIGKLYSNFSKEHDLESFESYSDLVNFWSIDSNFENLSTGKYGKLNAVYSSLILIELYDEFSNFLFNVGKKISYRESYDEEFIVQCKEVLKFCRELTIDLSKNDDFVLNKQVDFSYDFLSWRKNKYQSLKGGADKVYRLKFYIDNKQKELIERKKNQFKSDNFNLTLRKMTEYSNPKSFIYQVS
ncbi:radical SAM protein [Candidatus Woesearchaeota archaeon]|nr:radical SAM protein [Candidatus Woesearchaeota archaeon]MBT5399713.1 radical SAM protein [bacterium]